jgi:RNA polymerase sigma-70 factor (ECF subfamily)
VDRARPTPDDDVVDAFVNGDESALKHLYDAHSRLVHSYCRRVVGADLAADVTQEVFIAAWKSRDRFRPDQGTLTGWIMGIARFKAIDATRARARRPQLVDEHVIVRGRIDLVAIHHVQELLPRGVQERAAVRRHGLDRATDVLRITR